MIQFSKIRAVLLDMDGVVYVGDRPLPGVQDFLDHMEATGRRWLCVTNNSSKTPDQFVEKLTHMNVRAQEENVLGSSQATAHWMAQQFPERGKVVMVGQEGLQVALEGAGFELTDQALEADFVVAGIDFGLTYEAVAEATLAIRNGARFIGTNADPSFPSERGQVPGAGSILALISAATDGTQPQVIGKPNPGMFHQAMQQLGVGPHETMMIGDRYDTDIAGAIELGMTTVGVLTGVTTSEMFAAADPPPDLVIADLPALLEMWRSLEDVS